MDIEFDQSSISNIARRFLSAFSLPRVFAFHGPMGAGKTTFIHALCDELGITTPVSSPTFSIINEYSGPQKVYHLDLYRLKGEAEAINAGVEDCLYSGAICFAEWPERALALFPGDTVHVFIEPAADGKRRIRVEDK